MQQALLSYSPASGCRFIDGKPLPVSGHSEDQEATYGRAASSMARGYKLHAVFALSQSFVARIIQPMNVSEKTVAVGLIGRLDYPGDLVGDNAFDSNPLYDQAGEHQIQLLSPRRKTDQGLGHCRHSPHRLQAIELLKQPLGQGLLHQRRCIESAFGQLTSLGSRLAPLPNWVRTLRRVTNWILIKPILVMIYLPKQKNLRRLMRFPR